MTALSTFWQRLVGGSKEAATISEQAVNAPNRVIELDLDMAPNDPLATYLQSNPRAVEVDKLQLSSPALDQLRAAEVKLIVPLVSQGELIGMINLGERLSEQAYSVDDRKLLDDLATQAAPAVRVAQLVRQQQEEAQERSRIEQELKVARLIQQTLLPKELPAIQGWELAAHYQPAREVGGDFYDFLYLEDGQLGIVVGDVTDKGVPAALVMSTTRTLIRAAAERLRAPGAVLKRVNELLHPDIPGRMFVTCLYAVLDTETGRLRYANAGHDLPYRRYSGGVEELRATGMPLGLMPGMDYEEKEVTLGVGDTILLHSDGLAEAHNPRREMFGFPRLRETMKEHEGGAALIPFLLQELAAFTGHGWEQEDDVTLVTLQRTGTSGWESIGAFAIPSAPGNERLALEKAGALAAAAGMAPARLERLKTAVAEATMNGMEHGNQYDPDRPVQLTVYRSAAQIKVTIADQGSGPDPNEASAPNLDAKLAGTQSPRGWGLFLIQNMVDEMYVSDTAGAHLVTLIMHLHDDKE